MQLGELTLQVNRKAIKNLHISVLPPDGKIRVSAPNHLSDTAIRRAIIPRIPWIKKQQQTFEKQPRQSERRYVSGETHYLWGKRYRLTVTEVDGANRVYVKGSARIQVHVKPGTSIEKKEKLINEWYRQQLKQRIEQLIGHWQPIIGVKPSQWGVKKMKTKWGSCNTTSKRIWLNLELAKKPVECLEFILVHELVHLKERHHNDRFKQLMDSFLPDWRERRNLLNKLPLANESWAY